jgi:hypothetical protein
VQLTNKIISADDNTIIDIATDNLKSTALATSIDSSAPLDTKLTTEKAVVDYAVKKSTLGPYVYGTASGGAPLNYLVKLSIDVAATSMTVPTAKAVYDYSVPKTTGANVVYGTSSTGTAQNLDRVTSISSSSTNDQIPTAKAVYNFAVPQTNTGNRIYGTNGSGGETQYAFSDTYNSTATNQLFTRAGAYDMYTTLSSCANHNDQDVTITMTALENSFVFAQKQWARRIAKNVYAICFEMYRNASSAAGTEVRVNNNKNFKVNGSNVKNAALSAVSVNDSSPIGCTYNGTTFFFNPTRALGSGNTYIIRVTGIVFTV